MAIIFLTIFRYKNRLLTLCFVFSCQAASLLRSATAVSQRVVNIINSVNIELDFYKVGCFSARGDLLSNHEGFDTIAM